MTTPEPSGCERCEKLRADVAFWRDQQKFAASVMPTLEFVLPEGSPDPCPNACGGLTEDPYGGPCKACWAKVGRGDDDGHCVHCGEADCDGDACQDDLQETYPGSGIFE